MWICLLPCNSVTSARQYHFWIQSHLFLLRLSLMGATYVLNPYPCPSCTFLADGQLGHFCSFRQRGGFITHCSAALSLKMPECFHQPRLLYTPSTPPSSVLAPLGFHQHCCLTSFSDHSTSRSSCNGTHRCRNATGRWASPCDLSPVHQILDCMRPSQHVLGANMATVFLRLLPHMTPCPPQLSWTSMSLACPLKFSCLLRILESFLWRPELREVDNELHYCCCTSE